ncbi:sugar ABC transporter ATP-binding protein [Hoeflea sp. BAL378]|uniref:ABC transporter ATP-binding protein n=1 Tax=Hoeflea sp. BAL378 TaxID=1547437 RepID=UPI000512ED5A|nr:sn-glycerol-3-phosphate ABC transporter ATP-binding protein UgpC [Hoeflea sp. BAL378]KGF70081.1 sugar ABC transporter ATP-binding protein [Hoeflea sp. BAL378]
MADVRIEKLYKAYGTVEVIHGVDVDIPDGQFVVLVGPSGCGKSTLLRMIAGLEGVTAGRIIIGDRVVNNLPPAERNIAMVFQNYALYPHKTVAANMGFALKMQRMPKAEIDRKVATAAEILGLQPYLARYPRELSGGQRQRVAMGRAIVREPQVFLFDEPLSNLDAKLRVQMRTEIRELHQRLSTTTVYVTHDQIEAMTMADQIVVMRDGHISQQGAPLELYDRPANVFVAGFIGSPSMNLVEGVVTRGDGAASVLANGVSLAAPDLPGLDEGRSVIYGIRPEHLLIDDSGFEATVAVVEPTGPEIHLVLRAAGRELIAVLRERQMIRPGDMIRLRPQPEMAHLFDAGTGLRIG